MYLHLGSLIVSIYLLVSKEVDLNKKTLLSGYGIFMMTAFIALGMNIAFYKLNIINGETFNMFYISPYFISSLPLYDIIQSHTPYLVYLTLYFISIFLGGCIILGISRLIKRVYLHVKS